MTDNNDRRVPLILLVDDDPINIKIMRSLLEDAGYRTDSASGGRQCIDTVKRLKPDLVLLDIRMPGMSGIDVCKALKQQGDADETIVIFVTANTDDETLKEAFNSGGTDYVCKPINRIEMLARVKSALDQKTAAQRVAEEKKFEAVLATAGGVCHELNQPLQYVMGSVQLLMMDMNRDDPLYESMDKIRKQVERMGQITRKLMDITKYRTRDYIGGKTIIDIDRSAEK